MTLDLKIAAGDIQVPLTPLVGSLDQVELPECLSAALAPLRRRRAMFAAVTDRRSVAPAPLA